MELSILKPGNTKNFLHFSKKGFPYFGMTADPVVK